MDLSVNCGYYKCGVYPIPKEIVHFLKIKNPADSILLISPSTYPVDYLNDENNEKNIFFDTIDSDHRFIIRLAHIVKVSVESSNVEESQVAALVRTLWKNAQKNFTYHKDYLLSIQSYGGEKLNSIIDSIDMSVPFFDYYGECLILTAIKSLFIINKLFEIRVANDAHGDNITVKYTIDPKTGVMVYQDSYLIDAFTKRINADNRNDSYFNARGWLFKIFAKNDVICKQMRSIIDYDVLKGKHFQNTLRALIKLADYMNYDMRKVLYQKEIMEIKAYPIVKSTTKASILKWGISELVISDQVDEIPYFSPSDSNGTINNPKHVLFILPHPLKARKKTREHVIKSRCHSRRIKIVKNQI
jgi:hypothetical protein